MSRPDRPPEPLAITTDPVDERERFDFWRDVVSRLWIEMELRPVAELERFGGHVTAVTAGAVTLLRAVAGPTPHVAARTPAAIARADEQYFIVTLVLAGNGLTVQDERSAVLGPGDIALQDTSRPYTLQFERDFEMLTMQVPHALMRAVFPEASTATAMVVHGQEGTAALIRPLLNGLMNTPDGLSPAARSHLTTAAIELVAGSLADRAGLRTDAPLRAAHLTRARAHIEQHLWDPDLSPEAIARAVFLSERHLHTLFRDSGTTVARYLMDRRLDRAYRDLTDPRLAHVPVSDVAARLGFKSASHFTRTFTARFGIGPREHRKR